MSCRNMSVREELGWVGGEKVILIHTHPVAVVLKQWHRCSVCVCGFDYSVFCGYLDRQADDRK